MASPSTSSSRIQRKTPMHSFCGVAHVSSSLSEARQVASAWLDAVLRRAWGCGVRDTCVCLQKRSHRHAVQTGLRGFRGRFTPSPRCGRTDPWHPQPAAHGAQRTCGWVGGGSGCGEQFVPNAVTPVCVCCAGLLGCLHSTAASTRSASDCCHHQGWSTCSAVPHRA